MTTKTTFQFRVDAKQLYGALVDRICDAMENNEACLAPIPALTESIKIMLAGRISRERGGAEIKLSEIPAADPGFDGEAFERLCRTQFEVAQEILKTEGKCVIRNRIGI